MRFSRGFSFVEVMTVVALIGIMVAVTFVSLSGKRNEETLKAAAREVAASIRTAQSNALAGTRKGVPLANKNLCSVVFGKKSNSEYEIFVRYLTSGTCTAGIVGDGAKEIFSLSNGVVFGNTSNWNTSGNDIRFEIPRATVLPSSETSTICLGRSGQHISVSVSPAGVVTESAVNPGSC